MTQTSKRTIKPQPMTDEQKAAAIYRSVAQRVESTAQGVLFNIVSNPSSLVAKKVVRFKGDGKQKEAYESTQFQAAELAQLALDIAKEFITRTPKVIEEIVTGIGQEADKEAENKNK